jgi:hypothetical protein
MRRTSIWRAPISRYRSPTSARGRAPSAAGSATACRSCCGRTEPRRWLYRAYSGNGSDQGVLESCLDGLGELHNALDAGERRPRPASRTLVRDNELRA